MTDRRWRLTALCAVVVAAGLALSRAQGAVADTGTDADRHAIRSHIDRIFKAYIAKDRREVQATHDREWRGFLTGSPTIIRGIDEYMRSADQSLTSPARLIGYTMEDFDVQFRGPAIAVVPYVAELEGEAEGSRATWKLRVIDVYERQRGEWMQVASNTAMHPHSTFEQSSELQPMLSSNRAELLKAREAVWRAWFAGDEAALKKLLPPETIALAAGPHGWATRDAIIASALESAKAGTRLVALEFPRTEIQAYGATAILYTTYAWETETGGKRSEERGKAIEVFVRRQAGWVNSGWQLMADPQPKASE
ncbi:MAG: nuclear transport factor 2 family protein [Vicinamibacterales bacterium]